MQKQNHNHVKEWPQKDYCTSGQSNEKNIPLVDSKTVLLPPLQIEQGLIQNKILLAHLIEKEIHLNTSNKLLLNYVMLSFFFNQRHLSNLGYPPFQIVSTCLSPVPC